MLNGFRVDGTTLEEVRTTEREGERVCNATQKQASLSCEDRGQCVERIFLLVSGVDSEEAMYCVRIGRSGGGKKEGKGEQLLELGRLQIYLAGCVVESPGAMAKAGPTIVKST